jgi:RNA polymerase sigma-70 factor (ECF subfamily)
LRTLFRSFERPVFVFFLRVTGRRADAEDLTQETFTRACGAAVRYRGDASVRSWLFGIARLVLLESSRKGLFERPADVDGLEPAMPELDIAGRLDLEAAIARLRAADRESLILVDLLGFSLADAARLLDIEDGAFRMRLHRSRRRLRTLLEGAMSYAG